MKDQRPENPSEQIQMIRSMVEATKYNLYKDRFLYFMWGYMTLACAGLHYILGYILRVEHPYMVWGAMGIAGLVHVLYLRKRKNEARVRTYMDRVMAGIWGGLSLSIFAVLLGSPELAWTAMYPFMMILYGVACYASGTALGFRVLLFGGLGSILCGVIAFYQPFQHQLLLLMLAVLFSYIIPAHSMAPAANKGGKTPALHS